MVDLNEFSSIFQKVQHSHSRHQKTTSNLLGIHLKDKLRCSNGTPTRWRYEHKPIVKFSGASPKYCFLLQFSQNIDQWFQTKQFTRLLEFIMLYKQNLLDTIFIFTIYQNNTLALK